MIYCHLSRLMGEHKLRVADVVRKTGLKRNTVTLLYKGTAQVVDLEALSKLCELFDCATSDLLEYQPSPAKEEPHKSVNYEKWVNS